MTETQTHHGDRDTSSVDDVFDDTYREKEGKQPRVLVWRNIALMTLLHAGALFGLILLPSASRSTLAWTVACYVFSALGVTAGAHRLWSHRSYKASFPLRVFLAFGNSMAFQADEVVMFQRR
uniref:Acyl-CoA desaturase n=1 Tax=Nothobranchius furzeri TaxID=105023 RepID=A0A8C6MC49_NOTFU